MPFDPDQCKKVRFLYQNLGACKYYMSTLGGGWESEGNAYFAYEVWGVGSRGKMLILLM